MRFLFKSLTNARKREYSELAKGSVNAGLIQGVPFRVKKTLSYIVWMDSERISIPPDGQSFTLILDGEVILARSFGTDISWTETHDGFGKLIGMEYIFISTGGERIKIDILAQNRLERYLLKARGHDDRTSSLKDAIVLYENLGN